MVGKGILWWERGLIDRKGDSLVGWSWETLSDGILGLELEQCEYLYVHSLASRCVRCHT